MPTGGIPVSLGRGGCQMENDMPENINHSFVKTKLFNNENNAKKIKKIKAKQKVKSKQKTRKI